MSLTISVAQALSALPGPVAVFLEVDGETGVVVKADARDITGFQRPGIAVAYNYELARYDEGAVFRLFFEIRDRPGSPYQGETFLNPAVEADLSLMRKLEGQSTLIFHFYDMRLKYVFSKLLRHRPMQQRTVQRLTRLALDHNQTLAPEQLNFPAATARFQRERPIG